MDIAVGTFVCKLAGQVRSTQNPLHLLHKHLLTLRHFLWFARGGGGVIVRECVRGAGPAGGGYLKLNPSSPALP